MLEGDCEDLIGTTRRIIAARAIHNVVQMVSRFIPESSVEGASRLLGVPCDSSGCLFLASLL